MYLSFVKICLILVLVLFGRHVQTQRNKTIYQKIQQEMEYAAFNALVRSNRVARLNLHYEPLTVFIPENKAFDNYDNELHSSLAFYHMSFEVKSLNSLRTTNSIISVDLDNPPLWFTKVDEDIYVNNAKILQDRSNYVAQSRSGVMGKQQILHMIDEVLDPIIKSPTFSPTAFDFLSSTQNWNLGATKTVVKFFQKVQQNNLLDLYKQHGGHTFFIPVDSGIDSHKFMMIDKNIITSHIVPNFVLFTRPTQKKFAYKSMASDELSTSTISFFEEMSGTLLVKDLTKGNTGAEVIHANIPVKNGVVHLISQPLGIFKRKLKPFPYLPVLEKITNDPEHDIFYKMGEDTGFNKIFKKEDVNFTYFIPKDKGWLKTRKQDLEPTDDDLTILRRHLIVSQTPYSMEQLVSLCRWNNYTEVEFTTPGGPLRITALEIDGDYYIKWQKKYIKVVRPDYECTNGVIHILAGPMVNFKKTKENFSESDEDMGLGRTNYWVAVRNILSTL